ncbi:MAG: apolipoprotein N-acyltransferase [Planctomycetota bacterium]
MNAARPSGPLRWCLAGAATGLLEIAAFPPLGADLLILVAFVPLLLGLGRWGERGFLPGFLLAQALQGGAQLFWITSMTTVGALAWLGWALIAGLYLLFSLPLAWLLRRACLRARLAPWAVLAVVIPGHEILREWALEGLSWASPGYALGNRPLLVQAAELGGVPLVSAAVLLVNGGLAALVARERSRRDRGAALAAAVLAALLTVAFGAWRLRGVSEAEVEGPRLLGIQPNVTLEERREAASRGLSPSWHFLERQLALVERGRREAKGPIDLVVWPESSLPPLDDARRASAPVAWTPEQLFASRSSGGGRGLAEGFARATGLDAAARRTGEGAPRHLAGLQIYSDRGEGEEEATGKGHSERNAAILLAHRDGGLVEEGRYAKRALVPFGERVPGIPFRAELLDLIRERSGFTPAHTPGTSDGVMRLGPAGPRFGVTICYEIIFPKLFAEARRHGADFYVNVSNDVWYGDSAEMKLVHLALRFRAIENRRAIFRAGNTGISALIDAAGRERAVVSVDGRRERVAGVYSARVPVGDPPRAPDGAGWSVRAVFAAASILLSLAAAFGKSFRREDLGL